MTADQAGSPERLTEITSQPLPTATLQIRDPRHRLAGGKAVRDSASVDTEETIPSAHHDLLRHRLDSKTAGEGWGFGWVEGVAVPVDDCEY